MHPDFDQWYATLDLTDDEDLLRKRWEAVSTVSSEANWDDVDTLIRTSYGLRPSQQDKRPRVRTLLKKGDDTFADSGNEREFQILAGASLVALFEADSTIGRAAAMAVMTTSAEGGRTPAVPIDILGYAAAAISKQAEGVRNRKAAQPPVAVPRVDFKASAEKLKEGFTLEVASNAFLLAGEAANKAIRSLHGAFQTSMNGLQAQLVAQDEELDMLWWLVGGKSWRLGCDFKDVRGESAPFVLAAELGQLTRQLPGPNSVPALLARAGIGTQEYTIPTVVNAVSEDQKELLAEGRRPSAVMHPLHFAVDKRLETGEPRAWIASWAATSQLDAERRFRAIDIARQIYREHILLTLMKE